MKEPPIIAKIAKANLIGRGCNNFPTAKKWQLVLHAKSKEKYVVCNVSESEPGVIKDHYILVNWPERVIDGMRIAMNALKAKKGFIYLNPEYFEEFQERLEKFIKAAKVNIELFQKPQHDYIGGEESAALNAMEGKRVEPRLKPPFPTTHGFKNQPTLINNCETFYAVSLISKGEYKKMRFYSLTGDVKMQEVMELPVNITVEEALLKFGHKPSDKFFYQVGGGASGYCYNYKQLKRPFEGLAAIKVYDKKRAEKDFVLAWANFFIKESCGQCVPCREGTYRLGSMLEQFYLAKKKYNEIALMDLVFTLQQTSFCPLGRVSANALMSYWANIKGKKVLVGAGEKCEVK